MRDEQSNHDGLVDKQEALASAASAGESEQAHEDDKTAESEQSDRDGIDGGQVDYGLNVRVAAQLGQYRVRAPPEHGRHDEHGESDEKENGVDGDQQNAYQISTAADFRHFSNRVNFLSSLLKIGYLISCLSLFLNQFYFFLFLLIAIY